MDNGRTRQIAGTLREALYCLRCGACLNVCPVYSRTGGHAYGSVYPGPIGAILNPLLKGVGVDDQTDSLPYASSLCGACREVCPVMQVTRDERHTPTAFHANVVASDTLVIAAPSGM